MAITETPEPFTPEEMLDVSLEAQAPEVVDERTATIAMKRIALAHRKEKGEIEFLETEIARLKEMVDERKKVRDNVIEEEVRNLKGWHVAHFNEPEVGKTFRRGYGESKLAAGSVKTVVDDVNEFVDWAFENDRADLLTFGVNDKAVRDACSNLIAAALPTSEPYANSVNAITDDGEALPGLALERAAHRHTFKTL